MTTLFGTLALAALLSTHAETEFTVAEFAPSSRAANEITAPREATWESVTRDQFDPRRIFPGRKEAKAREGRFLADMKALAAAPLPEVSRAEDGSVLITVGDAVALLAEARRAGRDADSVLRFIEKHHPKAHAALGDDFRALAREAAVLRKSWDPEQNLRDDGFLMGPVWDLRGEGAPWKDLSGDVEALQAATLIFADLDAIKAAENDYELYPKHVGAAYEKVWAVRDSYLEGKDPRGETFSSLKVFFRQDLPFPFSHYDCDLRVLHRLDDEGHLETHVYSKSEDFHWMAARDVFVPVRTSRGEWVATLAVRAFGLDLDGVPEGRSNRETGVRVGLGNLRLNAERIFRERGFAPRTVADEVPRFTVKGVR